MVQPDPAWGTTTILRITPPPALDVDDFDQGADEDPSAGDPLEGWKLSDWRDIVLPNERGEIRHLDSGSRAPDTVLGLVCDGEGDELVALADAFHHTLDNEHFADAEYYLVLRVREIVDAEAWRGLPWGQLGVGEVFCAWDKFRGSEYVRTRGDVTTMSYSGDWWDLQHFIDYQHPLPDGPRDAGIPSPISLLRAIRMGQAERVRALLAAGADPNAGDEAKDEALLRDPQYRERSVVTEAILRGNAEIVEALLGAGARVEPRDPRATRPLLLAIYNRNLAVVPPLLRFGADPDLSCGGKSARQLLEEMGPAGIALLAHVVPRAR